MGNSPYNHNTYDNFVYYMNSGGIISTYFNGDVSADSCGIFISMIYYECDIDILYITITFYFLEVLKYEA